MARVFCVDADAFGSFHCERLSYSCDSNSQTMADSPALQETSGTSSPVKRANFQIPPSSHIHSLDLGDPSRTSRPATIASLANGAGGVAAACMRCCPTPWLPDRSAPAGPNALRPIVTYVRLVTRVAPASLTQLQPCGASTVPANSVAQLCLRTMIQSRFNSGIMYSKGALQDPREQIGTQPAPRGQALFATGFSLHIATTPS